MLTLKEIKKRLSDRNLSEVSKRIDVSYMTLWRILRKEGYDPSVGVCEKLSEYLKGEGK
tara:strand:+ start:1622 stop:1798 length:177 start_codon:yes stop_codon:yes gene_type:complete